VTPRVAPALVALALAVPLAAQTPLQASAAIGGGWERSVSLLGTTSATVLKGLVLGGEASARVGRVTIDGAYRQGTLDNSEGSDSRQYAEGHLRVMVATVPGLLVGFGPHARAYITNTGTQRWLFWALRVRGEQNIIGSTFSGYVEFWRSLTATVNVSESFDKATGGDVGMLVRFPESRFWGRVGYGIERAWLVGTDSRRETVEGLSLVLGYGAASVP
jgi:hypothetical protein